MQERAGAGGRSITDVLVDIGRNIQEILRSEIRLAQSEVRERLQAAGALVAIGVVGGLLSAFFLLLTLLYGLRLFMPPWAASLCIAVAVGLVAAIALKIGLGRLTMRPRRKSAESLKENGQWARPATK